MSFCSFIIHCGDLVPVATFAGACCHVSSEDLWLSGWTRYYEVRSTLNKMIISMFEEYSPHVTLFVELNLLLDLSYFAPWHDFWWWRTLFPISRWIVVIFHLTKCCTGTNKSCQMSPNPHVEVMGDDYCAMSRYVDGGRKKFAAHMHMAKFARCIAHTAVDFLLSWA